MALDKELIDKLLEGYQKPEDLIGENGLLKQLTKAVVGASAECGANKPLGLRKERCRGSRKGELAGMGKAERSSRATSVK